MSHRTESLDVRSWLVSAGRQNVAGEPLNVPLVPASNFVIGTQRDYARDGGTPTWEAFEEVVGGLEGGQAVAFASGMAAIAAVFSSLPVGARIALAEDCYQGVSGFVAQAAQSRQWVVQRIAVDDTDAWVAACARSDLVWLESPSNPLLVVADLETICSAPREPGCIVAVDNTFATPLNQRPLELGASVTVHSATKFLGGHSDLLAGVAVTASEAMALALRDVRTYCGATPGVLESYLALRGMRTLALRMAQAQENAMVLAERLSAHPSVDEVRYPGLVGHPNHQIAARQLGGFGTMISFDVSGGAVPADAACQRIRLIRHATSLGSVESTMERRALVPGQEHLPPGLLRLSVGIEDVEDLWRDLQAALSGPG